ncbi:hypothetical protein CMUS01_13875 [Colletotrichum musicola]|uniref:Uncharacterized protein n=1 Tax=Colletotrichum musicola TaxID=2175873 RepID=A0A8H6MTF8_9PEZI|nr:hypothetical protein CMUS01_13875 [Colletotrichum musicola]
MGEPSEPRISTREARGSLTKNNDPQSYLSVGTEWPLGVDSHLGQHAEGIPLTLLRRPNIGGHVGNPADGDYGGDDEAISGIQPLLDHHRRSPVDGRGPTPSDGPQNQQADIGGAERSPIDHPRTWRPIWLQPTILFSFMTLFLFLCFSLPAVLWYSQPNIVYLWRFGPTAVLTIFSALWSRVEFQALKYQPWVAHFQEKEAAKRARTLASVTGREPVDVLVEDLFNTSVKFLYGDTTAYYALQVFRNIEMQYPFGLTQNAAYQTFGTGDQSSRGTIDAPLEVVVNGFFSDMKCFKLKNHSVTEVVDRDIVSFITTQLQFESCELTIEQNVSVQKKDITGDFVGKWFSRDRFSFRSIAPCENLPQNDALYDAAMNMSRVLGPWAGHYRLGEHLGGSYSQTTGFRAMKIEKFLVNTWVPTLENGISFNLGGDPGTTFKVAFWESMSCPNGSQATLQSTSNHSIEYAQKISYVASIINSPGNRKDRRLACGGADGDNYSAYRYQTYVWGKFSWAKKDFEYMTTWRCKYTWIEIPTNISLTFVDGEYILDPKAPPQPDMFKTRPWRPEFDIPHINSRFDDRGENERNDSNEIGSVFPWIYPSFERRYGFMPDEFDAILRPHGRIPIEAFGDANREAEILKELNHNYAAFAAPLANLENRFSVNESFRTWPLPSGSLSDVVGTFTDGGRRRLVPNAPVAYFILGILGLVILAHVSALLLNMFQHVDGETWIFDMEVEGLAPEGLHGIAVAVALLKDSNASRFLPEGAHLLSSDELHGQLADLRFQMGWFEDADGNRKYTVGVLGDDEFKFLGKKKSVEKEDA